jgi:hypothetical protein
MDDQQSAFRRIMEVHDWTFAFGLPRSETQFTYALAVGEYAHEYHDGWHSYVRLILNPFETYIAPFEKVGLTIPKAVTSRRFAKLLRGTRGAVLFTHCNYAKGLLEFADGMVAYEDVVASVPANFTGIVDVSACKPVGFDRLLKGRAHECVAKITKARLKPVEWLKFYSYMFSEFATGPKSYAEAILNTTRLFGID